ncbi:methyltransferase domain-containing protein, partial [Pontibacter brevis]
MSDYLEAAKLVYEDAANNPQKGLCCTTTPVWQLPELSVPSKMLEMNYGCGSTVNPRDLSHNPTVLYVGVGGGMELLQFSYFNRRPGAVIGVDPVNRMLDVCDENLNQAAHENSWFQRDFIELRHGDALHLPLEDESVDVAAQNCLFNIFKEEELEVALSEMYRVLKPHARLEAISKIPKHYLHAREQQECQVIISLLFLSDQGS